MLESREKQVRRVAERQGYILRKSRRDGTWMVIDPASNGLVLGDALLEEVEEWLANG